MINNVMTDISIDSLPLGRVGYSSLGEQGYKAFSHVKIMVIQGDGNVPSWRLCASYTDKHIALVAMSKG